MPPRSRALLPLVLAALLGTAVAQAADTPLAFADATRQARYEAMLAELRCLVCQNQSLADSHADLAQDLRDEVYGMIDQGMDDAAIIDFMVDRYGDFVLYRPPVKATTWALWLGPAVLVAIATVVVLRRGRGAPATSALDTQERARLDALLAERERDTP